jgi:hypothetical protein
MYNTYRGIHVYSCLFGCVGTFLAALLLNNAAKNVPMQPNKHISQTTRYQLIFLFFNESKTALIKTISSCRYVTSIKPNSSLFNVCNLGFFGMSGPV